MTPIFDRNTLHVGWYATDNVFDVDGIWLAFHANGHIFSAATLEWLGPFVNGSLIDRSGRALAWLAGSQPSGIGEPLPPPPPARPKTPLRPVKPIAPRRPLFPGFPLRGWSDLSWDEWLGRRVVQPDEQTGGEGKETDSAEPLPEAGNEASAPD